MSGRLDDAALGRKEENGHRWAFRHCAHRLPAVGCEAKRNMLAMGDAADRREAIFVSREGGVVQDEVVDCVV